MMNFDPLQIAFRNLKANKVRSSLSMLGIVIGTGAVIVVTSIVNGVRKSTIDQMMAGSTDLLTLRPSYSESRGQFGKITPNDIERLKRIPFVRSAIPERFHTEKVRGTAGIKEAKVIGIDPETFEIYEYELLNGKKIKDEDVERRRRVCLINQNFSKNIFGIEYPIGQRIRLKNTSLMVIGIFQQPEHLKRVGKKADLIIPHSTMGRLVEDRSIHAVEIRSEEGKVDKVKASLEEMIKNNPRQAGLLEVQDPREYLKEIDKWAKILMVQVMLVAGVSLLVGGIGLMNVMLITVAERTREIGLRKAVGAHTKAILHQFLIESATLSGLGGLMGMVLGFLISRGIQVLTGGQFNVSVVPGIMLGSFIFAVVLGIVFGLYPASKAAQLSPVEALRYE